MNNKSIVPKKLKKKLKSKEADRIKKLNLARANYPSAFNRYILISEK